MGLSNDVDEKLATMKRSYDFFMMGAVIASKRILNNLEENEKKKIFKSKTLRSYREFYKRLGTKKKRTLDDWEFFLRYIKDTRNFSYFDVRLGFKVINFDTGGDPVKEYQSFKEKLLGLGFNLSKKDEKDWAEYLVNYSED